MLKFAIETSKAALFALAGSFFLIAVLSAFFFPPSEFHGEGEAGQTYTIWIDYSFLPALREWLPAYGIAFFATGIAVGTSRSTPAAAFGCFVIGILYAVHFGGDLLELVGLLKENGSSMTNEVRQSMGAEVRYSLIAVAEALFLMPIGAVVSAIVRRRLVGPTCSQE